jgi:hypothetical protein
MLKNSIECSETCIFDQLSKKFNIDMTVIKSEQQGECYQLGVNKNYHIIRENDYFFLGISEVKEDLNQSKLELESIRSGESGLHIIAPEAVNSFLFSLTRVLRSLRIVRSSLERKAIRIALEVTSKSFNTEVLLH